MSEARHFTTWISRLRPNSHDDFNDRPLCGDIIAISWNSCGKVVTPCARLTVSHVRYRCLHRSSPGGHMPYIVDFENVSTVGLESSPVAQALAGLRANEARYFKNKYDHVFAVSPASEAPETLDWVNRILADERKLVIAARPLETTSFEVDGIRMAYVFYESGLSINVMYTIADQGKRAVGFKLSEGMEVPEELAAAGFKFARQKSKLAGVIRGSFFVIKGEY